MGYHSHTTITDWLVVGKRELEEQSLSVSERVCSCLDKEFYALSILIYLLSVCACICMCT